MVSVDRLEATEQLENKSELVASVPLITPSVRSLLESEENDSGHHRGERN